MRYALIALLAVAAVARRDFSDSDSQRTMTWKVALQVFRDNPLVGVGPDGFQAAFTSRKPAGFGHEVAANAHNDILQVAATLGIFGLAAYLFLAFSAFSVTRGPALGALVALFVSAKFNPIPLEAMVLGSVLCWRTHEG